MSINLLFYYSLLEIDFKGNYINGKIKIHFSNIATNLNIISMEINVSVLVYYVQSSEEGLDVSPYCPTAKTREKLQLMPY